MISPCRFCGAERRAEVFGVARIRVELAGRSDQVNRQHWARRSGGWASLLVFLLYPPDQALALPPASEIPEEVLRAQPDLRARSPVDNQPLTAAEALELQEALAARPETGSVSPEVERLIFLLRLRKGFRDLFPFLF
jgi:hypothetical protein